jgi:hypothetical protein
MSMRQWAALQTVLPKLWLFSMGLIEITTNDSSCGGQDYFVNDLKKVERMGVCLERVLIADDRPLSL